MQQVKYAPSTNRPYTITLSVFDKMDTHEEEEEEEEEEEDYINMELISSPKQTKEFEFQYFSTSNLKQSAPSSADELFYKGKLLPLQRRHLLDQDYYSFLTCSTAPCTNSNTPLDSCNISPSESCRPSCDLNPTDFQWPPPDLHHHRSFQNQPTTNSWSKKLKMKMIKHSVLAQKLKYSRAYLKSLFVKSACSDDSSSKADAFFNFKYSKPSKKIKRSGISDDNPHRRSFSGAITTKCSSNSSSSSSSTSSSFNSSGVHELKFLRRSSSEAEIEVSIDAAIAHCKKSMLSLGIR